jgi:hypothetical protein
MEITNKMQYINYYSKSSLRVLGHVFAHHQKHLTVYTVPGSVLPGCCWLVSQMSWKKKKVLLMMGENIAQNM